MRNDERLRTIYEVMAPYIVRNEHNWRDYLAFASQFHKHSFDNILLVYAQDEDVSILATRKQWAAIGRNLIPRAKGVAVCVYRNAKLTLDYLFDVSQTTGKEIHPTDWQLSDEMKKALTERLSYAHGFPKQDFSQALYAMASESVAENYNHFLQELKQETKGHLFTEIPAGGFEAQYIQLLTDSISYFIGKKCHLPDEEIQLSDGMATVSHFNTLPLVAHLGTAVTALSKGTYFKNVWDYAHQRIAAEQLREVQEYLRSQIPWKSLSSQRMDLGAELLNFWCGEDELDWGYSQYFEIAAGNLKPFLAMTLFTEILCKHFPDVMSAPVKRLSSKL